MKKEDIEFLRELQHELNTQEHDGQAAPRYWGIEETHLEMTHDGEGEPYIITYDGDNQYTLKEYIEKIDEELVNEDFAESIIDEWNYNTDKSDANEVLDFANTYINTYDDYLVWLKETMRISKETGCFLTKRAAKNYLEKNYYHHNEGHTYAMTAWRNPEFEHLMNILQTMNIDDIKCDD